MENIIKKAIGVGWEPNYGATTVLNSVLHFCDDGSILATDERGKILEIYDKSKIVLDPLFFQALGKACVWTEDIEVFAPSNAVKEGFTVGTGIHWQETNWKYKALRFHEINLTQGWDKAVEYLEEIIK